MSGPSRLFRFLGSVAALAALLGSEVAAAQGQMDPDNPTCPANPNVSTYRQMRFTVQEVNGQRVLLAEGYIDDDLIPRLQEALQNFDGQEVWLRSPGGNARVGNQAGRLIRENNLFTRIPAGWVCFSACNFMFMGGTARYVDAGGYFMVHMFTHTQNRDVIRSARQEGDDSTIGLISEIEQDSALLATEDNDFLIRMGVSRRLLTDVMYQVQAVQNANSRETHRCLTQAQVIDYNVATAPWNGAANTVPEAQSADSSK